MMVSSPNTPGYSNGPEAVILLRRHGFDDFKRSIDQATDGNVCVLTLHGVPDLDHAWVHTEAERFEFYIDYLRENNCTVIALRDLSATGPTANKPAVR